MADGNGGADAVIGIRAPHEVAWHAKSSTEQILKELGTSLDGLSSAEAAKRLQQ